MRTSVLHIIFLHVFCCSHICYVIHSCQNVVRFILVWLSHARVFLSLFSPSHCHTLNFRLLYFVSFHNVQNSGWWNSMTTADITFIGISFNRSKAVPCVQRKNKMACVFLLLWGLVRVSKRSLVLPARQFLCENWQWSLFGPVKFHVLVCVVWPSGLDSWLHFLAINSKHVVNVLSAFRDEKWCYFKMQLWTAYHLVPAFEM
jgi:hypothetical protein